MTYFKLVHRWKRQRSDWIVLVGAKVDRFRVAVLSLGAVASSSPFRSGPGLHLTTDRVPSRPLTLPNTDKHVLYGQQRTAEHLGLLKYIIMYNQCVTAQYYLYTSTFTFNIHLFMSFCISTFELFIYIYIYVYIMATSISHSLLSTFFVYPFHPNWSEVR